MNSAPQSFQPQTIWYGGRPSCFPPMTPKTERVEKPKPVYAGPTMPCQHCGKSFGKPNHLSYAEFKRRKYCGRECELSAKAIARKARQDAIRKLLPATIDEMMAGTGMDYAEVALIIRLMVRDQAIVSKPNGSNPRIYREAA